ncbi:hypothetical protein RND81_10G015800 [Saponaria officinalis]|uniref:Fe2OG dioxygenase domain-containing protein n=1 Tax=Saponaria officinalis TaxID=3572 RepID=A0AAW1HXK9_SAPOF
MDFKLDAVEPPFEEVYENFFLQYGTTPLRNTNATVLEIKDLPLVDLGPLVGGDEEDRERCKREIVEASKEWGFFQVINHGIPNTILEDMNKEQVKAFREPFKKKVNDNYLDIALPKGSYRWGTPSPTRLEQLSWSEAFQIPLTGLANCDNSDIDCNFKRDNNLTPIVKQFATTVSELALKLANILDENLGHNEGSSTIREICLPSTSYLRMNRYPPCPKYFGLTGLVSHTDSDFLTILYQDQVGGLQLVKDGKWIEVKPNPNTLIVNIGDLFQAWSNGVYRSVEHRVVANKEVERLSIAFFLNPTYDAIIESSKKPQIYKKLTLGEYKHQIQQDTLTTGGKVGLSRFLLTS